MSSTVRSGEGSNLFPLLCRSRYMLSGHMCVCLSVCSDRIKEKAAESESLRTLLSHTGLFLLLANICIGRSHCLYFWPFYELDHHNL